MHLNYLLIGSSLCWAVDTFCIPNQFSYYINETPVSLDLCSLSLLHRKYIFIDLKTGKQKLFMSLIVCKSPHLLIETGNAASHSTDHRKNPNFYRISDSFTSLRNCVDFGIKFLFNKWALATDLPYRFNVKLNWCFRMAFTRRRNLRKFVNLANGNEFNMWIGHDVSLANFPYEFVKTRICTAIAWLVSTRSIEKMRYSTMQKCM